MIIETIFSTLDLSGQPNFAPMGIVWGAGDLIVRPFRSTVTCRNLLTTGCGVINLTDDVLAFVQSSLYNHLLPHFQARLVPGVVFQGACSWLEIEVVSFSGTTTRAEVHCRVVHHERLRDFLGFCRAGGAVLESAILATRVHLQPTPIVLETMQRFAQIVEKTGGENERIAFQLVESYIRSRIHHD